MRRTVSLLLVVLLAGVLGEAKRANAQGMKIVIAGPASRMISLLQNPSLQQQLNLSSEQINKIKGLDLEIRSSASDYMTSAPPTEPEEQVALQRKIDDAIAKRQEKAAGQLEEILGPECWKKFYPFYVRALGPRAFGEPKVLKALDLSEEQQKKMNALYAANKNAILGNEGPQKAKKAMAEVGNKGMKILTPEQQAKFSEIRGQKPGANNKSGGKIGKPAPKE
jgi:hypothetical protein